MKKLFANAIKAFDSGVDQAAFAAILGAWGAYFGGQFTWQHAAILSGCAVIPIIWPDVKPAQIAQIENAIEGGVAALQTQKAPKP